MFPTVSSTSSPKSDARRQTSDVRKFLLMSLVCCLMSSCGFHAVYAKNDQNDAVSYKLAEIRVLPVPEDVEGQKRYGQVLQTKLASLINPTAIASGQPVYNVKLKLRLVRRDLGIRGDLRVTRYDILGDVEYQLIEVGTNRELDSSTVRTKSSFNRTDSEFSTFIAEEDADEQAARELAQLVKERLIYYFSK